MDPYQETTVIGRLERVRGRRERQVVREAKVGGERTRTALIGWVGSLGLGSTGWTWAGAAVAWTYAAMTPGWPCGSRF